MSANNNNVSPEVVNPDDFLVLTGENVSAIDNILFPVPGVSVNDKPLAVWLKHLPISDIVPPLDEIEQEPDEAKKGLRRRNMMFGLVSRAIVKGKNDSTLVFGGDHDRAMSVLPLQAFTAIVDKISEMSGLKRDANTPVEETPEGNASTATPTSASSTDSV